MFDDMPTRPVSVSALRTSSISKMKTIGILAAITCVMIFAASGASAASSNTQLKVISVDAEGGMSVLFVTPEGKSLLFDSGWPTGVTGENPVLPPPPAGPGIAERIVAAAKSAGITKIDYVATSHYHIDHVGGLADLANLIPIGTFVDHGPNREDVIDPRFSALYSSTMLYAAYEKLVAGRNRISMKAGDVIHIGDLRFTAIASDGQIAPKPITGAGQPGNCTPLPFTPQGEDGHALGMILEWGNARILALSDNSTDLEKNLVCPRNLIGTVDLLFGTGHGSGRSTPEFFGNVKPRLIVVNNGSTKGNPILETMARVRSVQGVWQMHTAPRGGEKNGPPDRIANLHDPDPRLSLYITVGKNGEVTVTNPRTGTSKSYAKAP